MQRNDPPLQNDPWVISLRREMTRVIILWREIPPGYIFLRRVMTRVTPVSMGHFITQRNDPWVISLCNDPGHPSTS